jgi:hypothetical protein
MFVLQKGNNGPCTLPSHARAIHEKVGDTSHQDYSKKTFDDQTTRKRFIQNLLSYLVRELEVS